MSEVHRLVVAEIDAYGRVDFSEADAVARGGFAQYEVAVWRGSQLSTYYLNHQEGTWVPQIDSANAWVAFGDTKPRAAEALRAQRLVVADRMARDLTRFRHVTAGVAQVLAAGECAGTAPAGEAMTVEDLERAEARAYEGVRALLMDSGRMAGPAAEMLPAVKLLMAERYEALDACNAQRRRAEAADEENESLRGHIASLQADLKADDGGDCFNVRMRVPASTLRHIRANFGGLTADADKISAHLENQGFTDVTVTKESSR